MDTVLVLYGITGDLAQRKLLPALLQISEAGHLPQNMTIMGVSRQKVEADAVLNTSFGYNPTSFQTAVDFKERFEMMQIDLSDSHDYEQLATRLRQLNTQSPNIQILHYISVPPQVSLPIIENLGKAGIATLPNTKLMLEKPFGTDLASATDMVTRINKIFSEEQIYRIDHYLAKEMAQNISIFLTHNPLFSQAWNCEYIESIEVNAFEQIGIENRVAFYEQTGALRDVLQSHLMQLLALILSDPTKQTSAVDSKTQRLRALQLLHAADPSLAIRGQYASYRDEVDNPESQTETYAEVGLRSRDSRWANTLIRLRTGKALDSKRTEIKVTYKTSSGHDANMLIFRMQPDEGVELLLQVKKPGYQRDVTQTALGYHYDKTSRLPEAYEQVLVEAFTGNTTLFASGQEVVESWRVLDPIQKHWELQGAEGLRRYQTGIDPDDIDTPSDVASRPSL